MNSDNRAKILNGISKYNSWKMEQRQSSDQYIKIPVTQEKLSVSADGTDTSEDTYLLNFKADLESKILKKYLPNEANYNNKRIVSNPYSGTKHAPIWTKPKLSKSSFTHGEGGSVHEHKKTSVINLKKLIGDLKQLPGYFNSPAGKPYAEVVKGKKFEKLTENDIDISEISLEQPRVAQTVNKKETNYLD